MGDPIENEKKKNKDQGKSPRGFLLDQPQHIVRNKCGIRRGKVEPGPPLQGKNPFVIAPQGLRRGACHRGKEIEDVKIFLLRRHEKSSDLRRHVVRTNRRRSDRFLQTGEQRGVSLSKGRRQLKKSRHQSLEDLFFSPLILRDKCGKTDQIVEDERLRRGVGQEMLQDPDGLRLAIGSPSQEDGGIE